MGHDGKSEPKSTEYAPNAEKRNVSFRLTGDPVSQLLTIQPHRERSAADM